MSKSNYEIYAEKKQPGLLEQTVSLGVCIERLKANKGFYSDVYLDAQIELVAALFGLITEEVERAVNGDDYWCL